jgi:hypothetical protein
MRYAIDVVQADGSCRTLIVEVIGGSKGSLTVILDGKSQQIDWKVIAGWAAIDEEGTTPIILNWLPPGMAFPVCI